MFQVSPDQVFASVDSVPTPANNTAKQKRPANAFGDLLDSKPVPTAKESAAEDTARVPEERPHASSDSGTDETASKQTKHHGCANHDCQDTQEPSAQSADQATELPDQTVPTLELSSIDTTSSTGPIIAQNTEVTIADSSVNGEPLIAIPTVEQNTSLVANNATGVLPQEGQLPDAAVPQPDGAQTGPLVIEDAALQTPVDEAASAPVGAQGSASASQGPTSSISQTAADAAQTGVELLGTPASKTGPVEQKERPAAGQKPEAVADTQSVSSQPSNRTEQIARGNPTPAVQPAEGNLTVRSIEFSEEPAPAQATAEQTPTADSEGTGDTGESSEAFDDLSGADLTADGDSGPALEGQTRQGVSTGSAETQTTSPAESPSFRSTTASQIQTNSTAAATNITNPQSTLTSGAEAQAKPFTANLPVTQPAVVASQVVTAVSQAVESQANEPVKIVTVELNPVELGRVNVRIEQQAERIAAHIVATEAVSSEILNAQKGALQEALSSLGFDEAHVEVSHDQNAHSHNRNRQANAQTRPGLNKSDSAIVPSNQEQQLSSSRVSIVA